MATNDGVFGIGSHLTNVPGRRTLKEGEGEIIMAFCSACQAEYLPHVRVCPECQVALGDVLMPHGYDQIYTASNVSQMARAI